MTSNIRIFLSRRPCTWVGLYGIILPFCRWQSLIFDIPSGTPTGRTVDTVSRNVRARFHNRTAVAVHGRATEKPPCARVSATAKSTQIAYDASRRNRQFQDRKPNTKVAQRGQVPRGVSSCHVFYQAFGDAFLET